MVQKRSKRPESPEPRRRGRPRQYDPDLALASAANVFWKYGYAATSLDDLAAATGMNRPSLYAAFGDKRDLYLKTLQHYRDESRAITAKLLAEDLPLPELLRRAYTAAIDIYLTRDDGARGCYSISTAPAQATTDPAVRDFLAGSIHGSDVFFEKVIARARDRGEIAAAADPSALAQIATATLHTLAVRSRVGVSRQELLALTDNAIGLICGKPAGRKAK
jgi:TetR/AcrR family transcriptional regulator, copper-responsive repressor